MSHSQENCVLVDQWRAGDQEAARSLFDRYARRLVGLARQHISQRLAARVDPEDAVQSAFFSFFRRLKEGEFHFQGADDLWNLLARITVCKTLRQIEHHSASKRNPDRETPSGNATEERWREVLGREPSPADALALQDELEHFLAQFSPQERQIVEMRLAGYSAEEIGRQMGTYERKVRRVLEKAMMQAKEASMASRSSSLIDQT